MIVPWILKPLTFGQTRLCTKNISMKSMPKIPKRPILHRCENVQIKTKLAKITLPFRIFHDSDGSGIITTTRNPSFKNSPRRLIFGLNASLPQIFTLFLHFSKWSMQKTLRNFEKSSNVAKPMKFNFFNCCSILFLT